MSKFAEITSLLIDRLTAQAATGEVLEGVKFRANPEAEKIQRKELPMLFFQVEALRERKEGKFKVSEGTFLLVLKCDDKKGHVTDSNDGFVDYIDKVKEALDKDPSSDGYDRRFGGEIKHSIEFELIQTTQESVSLNAFIRVTISSQREEGAVRGRR